VSVFTNAAPQTLGVIEETATHDPTGDRYLPEELSSSAVPAELEKASLEHQPGALSRMDASADPTSSFSVGSQSRLQPMIPILAPAPKRLPHAITQMDPPMAPAYPVPGSKSARLNTGKSEPSRKPPSHQPLAISQPDPHFTPITPVIGSKKGEMGESESWASQTPPSLKRIGPTERSW
jgi:hypothetical protein